ncbi:MAG: aspartate 1-decarboxylase [Syntrophales bacterium]|nr:aspartate 1-decarboxylase [Syntrophales bacterium]MDD4338269.1 aspartate 1-decarboxylase [Syntrophales bacterium]HOG08200.1 aspartate 1-decarboxylase [Syntrophales bacterium]HOS77142.1 aspartate 1-decarboxylase [Syntrophales bacterium]HPB70768.1 aspartate 1-decarboxylase [Syntrophales bacterium]
MQRFMLKSKLHRATVTDADLHYEGSITIDEGLMEAADFLPFEKVSIYDVSNGERFSTYVIRGKRDSGVICLNGAAARKVSRGDLIIIASYVLVDDADAARWSPRCVLLDEKNRIKKWPRKKLN